MRTANIPSPCECAPLNTAYAYEGLTLSATSVAIALRRQIALLHEEFLSTDGKAFDYVAMSTSASFASYVRESSKLQVRAYRVNRACF